MFSEDNESNAPEETNNNTEEIAKGQPTDVDSD